MLFGLNRILAQFWRAGAAKKNPEIEACYSASTGFWLNFGALEPPKRTQRSRHAIRPQPDFGSILARWSRQKEPRDRGMLFGLNQILAQFWRAGAAKKNPEIEACYSASTRFWLNFGALEPPKRTQRSRHAI